MLDSLVRLFKHTEKAIVAWCDAWGNNFVTWPVESSSKCQKRCILVLPFLANYLLLEKVPYR
jgi:hypothetical protein